MAQYTRRRSGLLVRTQAVDTYLRDNALAYGIQPALALPVFDRGQRGPHAYDEHELLMREHDALVNQRR